MVSDQQLRVRDQVGFATSWEGYGQSFSVSSTAFAS